MMMNEHNQVQIGAVVRFLDSIAPPVYQESYDNAGLIVGDKSKAITGVLICLDTLESVLDEAIAKKCNLIVAHHPIVFKGLKTFTGKNYVERVIMKAIRQDIAIYVAHTNLDNMYVQGVNSKIAEKLGLTATQILAPKRGVLKKLYVYVPSANADSLRTALFEGGAGHIGNYSECSFSTEGKGSFKGSAAANPTVGQKGVRHYEKEEKIEVIYEAYKERAILQKMFEEHPYEEVAYDIVALDNAYAKIGSGLIGSLKEPVDSMTFLKFLKARMQTDCIRYTDLVKDSISRVAVCGGAGSFLLRHAIAAKADIFITADYKYHQFFDAENHLIIADIGHFESEQYTIDLFYELLTQKFINFAVYCTEIKTNPINYL